MPRVRFVAPRDDLKAVIAALQDAGTLHPARPRHEALQPDASAPHERALIRLRARAQRIDRALGLLRRDPVRIGQCSGGRTVTTGTRH